MLKNKENHWIDTLKNPANDEYIGNYIHGEIVSTPESIVKLGEALTQMNDSPRKTKLLDLYNAKHSKRPAA